MKVLVLWIGMPLLLAQSGTVIEGIASNKVTHAGVAGVTIKLAAAYAPDKALYVAESDAAGAFRIAGVKDGDYVASYDAPNGFEAPDRWDPWCRPFHVAATREPMKLDVPVTPLASLRGRVLDPDGHPVPRVRVELFRVHYAGGSIMTTDAEGRFFEDHLNSGAYMLRARPVLAGSRLAKKPGDVSPLPTKPPEGERWTWAPTYFPNSVELSGAMSITVRDGAELAGYEIRLRSAPVYSLRGVALDDEGKPAAGVELYLLSEIGWGTAEAYTKSGEDGAFEFPSVRAGEWHITAEATRGRIKWKGFSGLTMPRRDLEGITLRIAPPFTLEGAVEGTPQPRTAKTRVTVSLLSTGPEEGPTAVEEPDGTLCFEDVYPGSYQVGVWTKPPGYYLKSILLGTEEVTGQDVVLAQNSPPLRVIYKSNAARAVGKVENGAGVKVVLIEAEQKHFVPGQFLRVEVCDAEGRFTFEGLRPTAYYAFAFAIGNVESGGVTEAVFAKGLARQAETLKLEEGETATLKLKITPWPE